ncbi:hypothetical protein ACIQOV_40030 [Kitasatospora sp. NPDC091257]|uniref:hypothetical protein n=1 Tax=unclassified Kitasatospora TaxID=2633591 RepID=UPI002F90F44A
MNVSSRHAETYLDRVDGALTLRGLRPAKFTVGDTDDLLDGSVTAIPGAVLEWPAGHSKLDPERFPHGAVATWTAAAGWQAAALLSDGTSDTPTLLPLTTLGEPSRIVDVIAHVLLGRAAPDKAEQTTTDTPEADPIHSDRGPATDPALATLRAEIWGHLHNDPQGRTEDGCYASRLSFPVAGDGHSWSQEGVQITYGDTNNVTDLDGYHHILEHMADRCPAIEGPLVLTL